MRAPRVTGVTACRLLAGYRIMWPAGSFTLCRPYVSSTVSSPPSYSSGAAQEQRGGDIRPHAMRRQARVAHGRVDVHAEVAAAFVSIEERRKHFQRQGRRGEERIARELAQDDVAQLARHRMLFRELQVVLHLRGLRTGGGPTVRPIPRGRASARKSRHLVSSRSGTLAGPAEQHRRLFVRT